MRLLLAGIVLLAGCGVTQVLDRAADGTPILIRTPQPDAGDLEELHDRHGVRTVLNLRGENEEKGWFQEERRGVRAIGARWEHLKVSGTRTPEPDLIAEFFALVEDRERWPIVMHCAGGIHRTGVLSALYRVQYQGWDAERAVEEMEDHWFDWTTRDRDALKRFLRAYEVDPDRHVQRGGPPPNPVEPPE
jgi:protein tyrosine phosphatase (PTP) superfamily phosphohydrolase (DUF442 family)